MSSFLFYLSRESRLAGDFGYMVPDQIMPSGVEALIAKASMPSKLIKNGAAGFAPLGGSSTFESSPWGWEPHSVL